MQNQISVDPFFSISHTLSLLQQNLWNCMLLHAYKNLQTKTYHTISLRDLLNFVPKTKNNKDFKKQLLELKNNLNQQHFKELTIIDDIIYYSYPDNLIKIYKSKNFLSTLRLITRIKFSSKYALFFYELANYLFQTKIPSISIDSLRHFMGLHENKYINFKILNHHVINKALTQINILCSQEIEITYIKEKKAIKGLSLSIKPKKVESKSIASLKKIHGNYLESKAYQTFDNLPKEVQEKLNEEYTSWFKEVKQEFDIWAFADRIKKIFLIQKLVSPLEQDFELWSLAHGYESKKLKISI